MYITLSLTNILTNYLLEPGTALRYIHEQCSLDEQGVAEYCSKPSKLHACLFVLIYGGGPSICAACVCVYCVATLHIIFLGNCNATTYFGKYHLSLDVVSTTAHVLLQCRWQTMFHFVNFWLTIFFCGFAPKIEGWEVERSKLRYFVFSNNIHEMCDQQYVNT